MSTLKRVKVVMLPTNEKAPEHDYLFLYQPSNRLVKDGFVQHLYILSDEEIKEGDWCYDKLNNKVYQASSIVIHNMKSMEYEIYLKKIIATTDKSLGLNKYDQQIVERWGNSKNQLPQPSEGFLDVYVDFYNRGKPITEVMVEYEEEFFADSKGGFGSEKERDDYVFRTGASHSCWSRKSLKINPKDNTITIHKCKDSWSKEEVKALALQSFLEGVDRISAEDFDKWIEENL